MPSLTVRLYNVGFGDATLVTIPDRIGMRETTRHILIDMGNVFRGAGGRVDVFKTVAADIKSRLAGRPVDLFVMTHEHLDHVQGLKYLADEDESIPVNFAWLTASAAPNYGRRFPEAKKRLELYREQYHRIGLTARKLNIDTEAGISAFLRINDHQNTSKCVKYLRNVATVKTSYVHRRFPIKAGRDHPFTEAQIRVLAPELDTTSYYGRLRPLLRLQTTSNVQDGMSLAGQTPPEGVDERAFFKLIDHLQTGFGDDMLAIDRAANNTSIVLLIEWRGWRLLFPGDAEEKSWRIMAQIKTSKTRLQPVHFIKLSHHGSINGAPGAEILNRVLPQPAKDKRPRYAAVSTHSDTYNGVPAKSVLDRVSPLVKELFDTRKVELGDAVEIPFPDMSKS